MNKKEYAKTAIKEFKKLGRMVTNTEIVGNQKNLTLLVGCREKGKSDAVKKLQSIAYKFDNLQYIKANDDGNGPSKAGYYHYVAVYKIK